MAQIMVPLAISAALQVLSLLLMPKPKVDKPRLPDQSYGTPIPRGWGRFVVNGNYIWGYTTQSGGGKGQLGPQPPELSGTFALLLCEGQIADIRRVWWDGKLVYDKSPDHDPDPAIIELPELNGDWDNWQPIVEESEQASERHAKYMRLYRGIPGQDPNPHYQDRVGTDRAPAYRGFATLWYLGVPLENRHIPYSIKVEVIERTETLYLSDILRDICLSAMYEPRNIDVEDVDDIVVRGFYRNPEPPIETIKRLQVAYQFDVVDVNGKVSFKKQARTGAYGLARTDLGCYEYGNDQMPLLFTHTLINENEKIHEVRLKYVNYRREYEDDEVYERRLAVNPQNVNKQDFETNLTLTPDEARSIVVRLLYLAQLRADQFKFSLPLHYFKYFPNDILYGEFYEGEYNAIQLTKKRMGFNGLVEFEGILYGAIPYYNCHDRPAYVPDFKLPLPPSDTQNPTFEHEMPGQSINPPRPGVPHRGESLCKLLDIPLLRDSDPEVGLYAVSAGTYSWRGGTVYGVHGGGEYRKLAQLIRSSTWGNCVNTLGDASFHVLDRRNSLTVQLKAGALTNIGLDQMVAGDNTALIYRDADHYELIRFQYAVLVNPKTYRLSILQRGVRGTEWGIGEHQGGELFYLLRSKGYYERIEGQVREIGQPLTYRVPAPNQTLDEATAITITPKSHDLYPYAPCTIRGDRDGMGGLLIRWVRRDRKADDLPWFNPIPLSETLERYVVQILENNTVKREVEINDLQEYWYSTADQVSDFGTVQPSVKVRLYQVSAVVGKGFAGVKTL